MQEQQASLINKIVSHIIKKTTIKYGGESNRVAIVRQVFKNHPSLVFKFDTELVGSDFLSAIVQVVLELEEKGEHDRILSNFIDYIFFHTYPAYMDEKTAIEFAIERYRYQKSQAKIDSAVKGLLGKDTNKSDDDELIADTKLLASKPQGDMSLNPNHNSILGNPIDDPQFHCDIFMVMPFRPELDEIYVDHTKPTVKKLDLSIKRGDDPFTKHGIVTEIWSLVNYCQLVIADCTGRNPNVFYEIGLAHAIDKPVLLLTQNSEDVPFDIRHLRYIKYANTSRGMKKFETDLTKAIQGILSI